MPLSITRHIVGGVAITAGLGLLLGSCSDQPRARCAAARGNFAAAYHLVSGSGDCAGLKGDVLSVQTYNGSNGDKTPNWDDASMAIQPMSVTSILQAAGGTADPNPANKPYALGHFATAEPGPDDFCVAPELSPGRLQLPEIPAGMDGMGGMTPALPATDLEYRWSNVRVYVTAAANGTMFRADLTVRQASCTAQYTVDALYPAVSCAVPPPMEPPPETPDPDASVSDGNLADGAAGDVDGSVADVDGSVADLDGGASEAAAPDGAEPMPDAAASDGAVASGEDATTSDSDAGMTSNPPAPMLDETLCSPVADLSRGRPLGSGINPDVLTRCDPDLQLCVLAKAPPSAR